MAKDDDFDSDELNAHQKNHSEISDNPMLDNEYGSESADPMFDEYGSEPADPLASGSELPTLEGLDMLQMRDACLRALEGTGIELSTQELGRGSFGVVYKGQYKNTDVAIKFPLKEDPDFLSETQFGQALNSVNSKHIIYTHQIETKLEEVPFCVTKIASHGALHNYIRKQIASDQTRDSYYQQVTNITSQIMQGVQDLHSQNKIHRDIATRNFLVDVNDAGINIMLADFGRSKQLENDNATYENDMSTGPMRWMSPGELIEKDGLRRSSKASDLWAIAATLCELHDGHRPYNEVNNPAQAALCTINIASNNDQLPSLIDLDNVPAEHREQFEQVRKIQEILYATCLVKENINIPNQLLSESTSKFLESKSGDHLDIVSYLKATSTSDILSACISDLSPAPTLLSDKTASSTAKLLAEQVANYKNTHLPELTELMTMLKESKKDNFKQNKGLLEKGKAIIESIQNKDAQPGLEDLEQFQNIMETYKNNLETGKFENVTNVVEKMTLVAESRDLISTISSLRQSVSISPKR